ncbi:MAG: hypothetical protein HGA87_06015 [Desulfobulbaceae bacterium]|nr:hypothetical protein [Desulfobulbaceae bacterium]
MKRLLQLCSMLFIFAALSAGCGRLKELNNNAPPGRLVAISQFKCNSETLVRELVQDSFVDVFFKSTNAKVIKGDKGEITIVGIINIEEGQSGRSKGAVFGGGSSAAVALGGSSAATSASGAYVSGITVQAYKGDELLATHSVGQNLGQGVLISPVMLAKEAANYIATILVRKNEIGRN